jgi:hypothetical protein
MGNAWKDSLTPECVPKNWSSSSPGTRALCSRSGGKTSGAAERAAQSGGLRTPPDLAGTADSPRRRSEFRLLHGVCRAVADSVPPDSQDGLVYYGFCRKVRFLVKIQKLGVVNSMAYRLPNSQKSNFATEPNGLPCGCFVSAMLSVPIARRTALCAAIRRSSKPPGQI